jgi:hypothetical protein
MREHSLIRTIYLYIFALLGLVLLVIGGVRFLDMGLKMFVFTQADAPERLQKYYVPMAPVSIDKLEKTAAEKTITLTENEATMINSWLQDYKKWQAEESKIDYLASRRQRDASINLAMILVGLPLYLYHWLIIKRETKRELVVNG